MVPRLTLYARNQVLFILATGTKTTIQQLDCHF
jgi:hypothetical protein